MAFNPRIVLTIGLALLGAACNSDLAREVKSGEPKPNIEGQKPVPQPQQPSPVRRCQILVPEADFNRFVAEKSALLDNYFVEPGQLETCAGTDRSKITGYNSLTVYPPVQVTGDARYNNGEIEVPIGTAEITEEFRKSLASELGLTDKDSEKLNIHGMKESGYPFEAHAAPESMPRVKARRKQVGLNTVLVFSRKKRIKEKRAKAFIQAFAQGKKGIRTFFQGGASGGADLETGSILLHAREHQKKNRYKRISKLEVLADFWTRAELAQPEPPTELDLSEKGDESPDRDRDDVLKIAVQWRYHLSRLPKERVQETLAPMIEYASRRWIPNAPEPQADTASSDLVALEFLAVLDAEGEGKGPLAPYYSQFLRLQPYYGYENSPHSLAYLNEIIQIVDHGTLTESQLTAVHGIAGQMNYEQMGNPAVWETAKQVCGQLGFHAAKISRFTQLFSAFSMESWRQDRPEAATQILALILRRPDMEDKKASLLSQALTWNIYGEEIPFTTPGAAVTHAECLVFQRAIDQDKLNRVRESYRLHLSIGLSPPRALEHAEAELLESACPI
ncbi:MAG: hypothetical protein A2X94_10185 [Bdellovibrionales bacterium GWB1_55_8]|nr:MAG: hypothetical protein A2X94_10185 [Bdellovibrionales bacterium GWB1_55_8]